MNQFFALLDIGGSAIKSSIGNVQGMTLGNIRKTPTPLNIAKRKLFFEISPEEILLQIRNHLKELIAAQKKISGLLISGQMGSWVITDEKNFPLMNLVSWQDMRAVEEGQSSLDALRNEFGTRRLVETGNEFRPGLPIFGLRRALNELEGKRTVRVHTLISWITSQICKDYSYTANATDAASIGFFNLKSNLWEKNFIEENSIETSWPRVTKALSVVGVCEDLKCEVFTSVGDQQASLLGAGLTKNNIVVNIGTGGQVAAIRNPDFTSNLQTRPYFFGDYIQTRTHLPAGRAISNYIKNLYPGVSLEDGFNIFEDQSEMYETDEVIIPTLEGNNISTKQLHPREAPSAIMNGIAERYRIAIAEIDNSSNSELIFAGGIGQKMKSLQKRVGSNHKFVVASADETTLQGLLLLARQLNSN